MSQEAPAPQEVQSRPTVRRAATVVIAVVVMAVVWTIVRPVLGVDLAAKFSGDSVTKVGLASVIIATAVAALAGWGLLALLERSTGNGRRIWTIIAVVVVLLSLVGPAAGVTTGAKISLAVMHLVAGSIVIAGFTGRGRKG